MPGTVGAGSGTGVSSLLPDWVQIGSEVKVSPNKKGVIKYSGRTHFSEGTMVGVSLHTPHG